MTAEANIGQSGLRPGDVVWHPNHGWGRFTRYVDAAMACAEFNGDTWWGESATLIGADDPALPSEARETRS